MGTLSLDNIADAVALSSLQVPGVTPPAARQLVNFDLGPALACGPAVPE
jgi:hypothetical protein